MYTYTSARVNGFYNCVACCWLLSVSTGLSAIFFKWAWLYTYWSAIPEHPICSRWTLLLLIEREKSCGTCTMRGWNRVQIRVLLHAYMSAGSCMSYCPGALLQIYSIICIQLIKSEEWRTIFILGVNFTVILSINFMWNITENYI